MSEAALKRAVEKAGGPGAVGRALGISSAAVSQWQTCPPLRVLSLETLSGVSRHELRPDIYGQASVAEPTAQSGAAA